VVGVGFAARDESERSSCVDVGVGALERELGQVGARVPAVVDRGGGGAPRSCQPVSGVGVGDLAAVLLCLPDQLVSEVVGEVIRSFLRLVSILIVGVVGRVGAPIACATPSPPTCSRAAPT
jgi:hypothetical protein